MSSTTLLLDSNVWLDFYLGYRAGNKAARDLVNAALAADVALLYAVTTLKDVYYVIASEFKRLARKEGGGAMTPAQVAAAEETAWACVCNMRELASAVGVDESDIWIAGKEHALHRDLEDDLIVAAVVRSKATYLVTNDQALLRHCGVAALDVQDMCVVLGQMGG